MKILWLSNVVFSASDNGATGTWLHAMARRLTESGQITLGNISMGAVRELTSRDFHTIRQWLVPEAATGQDGLPRADVAEMVIDTIRAFSPDVIHIWGVESWWGLVVARLAGEFSVLQEIQGLKHLCARAYAGGLTASEQRQCRGWKEIVLGRSIERERRRFIEWGDFEREMIARCRHISAPSPWIEGWVRAINTGGSVYRSELMLRPQFYEASAWTYAAQDPVLFCSAAYPLPFKGLHDVVRATAILSHRFPALRLRIAGAHRKTRLRQDGYVRWLSALCATSGIASRVEWLGALPAEKIVDEIEKCSVFVMPSHCESYSVSLAEALYLGCPSVTTYTGGTSWLVTDNGSGLFYLPGDEAMLAYQVERVLTDPPLAITLSGNARNEAVHRNDPEKIVSNQLQIYRRVARDRGQLQVDNSSDGKGMAIEDKIVEFSPK